MALSLEQIVRVTAEVTQQRTRIDTFNRTLFLHPVVDTDVRADLESGRVRDLGVNTYSTLDAVSADYPNGHSVGAAAQVYFAQSPRPRELLTAGWFKDGAKSLLYGAPVSGAGPIATIRGLGSTNVILGAHTISVDLGGGTGTSAAAYVEKATTLQTAIQGVSDLSAVTVAYTDSAFVVTAPAGVNIGGPLGSTAAEALGLGEGQAVYLPGTPVETISAALDRTRRTNAFWYWLTLDNAIENADKLAVASWIESEDSMQGIIEASSEQTLISSESVSLAAQVSALESERTPLIWSRTADYKSAALAGNMAGIDLNAPNSIQTAKFLTFAVTTPDVITLTQKQELDRKRVNHYSPFGVTAIFAEGWAPKSWIDTRLWLDWIIARIQTDVFALLRATPRVPLTPQGQSLIQAKIVEACEAGRRNGGISGRAVSDSLTEDILQKTGAEFDGVLPLGYKVYAPPVSTLTPAQRDIRQMTAFNVWLAGSGATHYMEASLSFEA